MFQLQGLVFQLCDGTAMLIRQSSHRCLGVLLLLLQELPLLAHHTTNIRNIFIYSHLTQASINLNLTKSSKLDLHYNALHCSADLAITTVKI